MVYSIHALGTITCTVLLNRPHSKIGQHCISPLIPIFGKIKASLLIDSRIALLFSLKIKTYSYNKINKLVYEKNPRCPNELTIKYRNGWQG